MALVLQEFLKADKLKNSIPSFTAKVEQVAKELGIDPNALMLVMYNESNFNPGAKNPTGGATGLIQFMPDTLKQWGITPAAMLSYNGLQQLDYVYKYLKPARGKLKDVYDIYLYIFYPLALNKPDSFVIGSERSDKYARLVATQNKIFAEGDYVTKGSFKRFIQKRYKDKLSKLKNAPNVQQDASTSEYDSFVNPELIVGLLAIVGIGFIIEDTLRPEK